MSARALAIRVLARVQATGAYLNAVLDAALDEAPPRDARDTALVTELCYGTTRRQLALDFALARFCTRRLETLEDRVLAALRVGAYQLFYLRVPQRAAVGETVEALKELGVERAAGLVNAVLRKLAALEALPLPGEADAVLHLSVRESHPSWLVARWLEEFGRERAEAMLVADNQSPPVVVRANSTKVSRDELLARFAEAGMAAQATRRSTWGIALPRGGRLDELYGYAEGLWQVQDEAAQLVGLFSAPGPGSRVLDTCAAPGGKACHLAERFEVTAADVHEGKLRKLQGEARRLGLLPRIRLLVHDATTPFPEELGRFDVVLVDAPCSGLGTLRRHPELRYRRQPEDIGRLAELQGRILASCQQAVSPGGLLVYAVCSQEPEEGPRQMESFLRAHPEFAAEPQEYLRTLPGPEGLDGFFCARLRRRA